MVSRRKQTSLPSEQPVRFYKIIALTFLFLTLVLFGAVIFMSSKRAVITIETKATPVDVKSDVVVGTGVENAPIAAIVTTTVIKAEETFSPTGSKEEPGIVTGVVTLHNEAAGVQVLVATTRLLSPDGVLFRLKKAVSVPGLGTVQAEVYADKPGKESEIAPTRFTIPGLNEARQKVVYATNGQPLTGGVKKIGILSEADLEEAEKHLIVRLEKQAKDQLSAFYPGKEVVFSVGEVTKKTSAKVGETVSQVKLEGQAPVALVVYDKTELKNWAQATIQNQATGDTQIIRSSDEEPKVTLQEYSADKNQATLHVFLPGVATVNPQSKQLEKSLFFGKSRDEVKRYLLSLEHIQSIEVEFHPFWMQTVPHIHDHVQVIVKEVK